MVILITGASGFIGRSLLPLLLDKGYKVYGLYRKQPESYPPSWVTPRLVPLHGDITLPNLGIAKVPEDIDAVIHCAALLSFSSRDKERIHQTNYQGTVNLLEWMKKYKIARLFHLSTAYLFGHNYYETSKQMAEEAIREYPEIKTTIFRPSIIIGDSKVQGFPPLSGFYLGIGAIDRAKTWVEQKSGLPPLRTQIRICASPGARLNLIPVDIVAENIVDIVIQDKTGVFELSHPDPPLLGSLEKPISEAIGADIRFVPDFKPNLLERVVALSIKELAPYIRGLDLLPSDIKCPPFESTFIEKSLRAFLTKTKG